jgi:hypothetical protein
MEDVAIRQLSRSHEKSPHWNPNLGFVASITVRKYISVALAIGLWYFVWQISLTKAKLMTSPNGKNRGAVPKL